MHSSVLIGSVVPRHMSASGSRGIIHIHSSVVTVARATGKISCFPPPLVCIRTVSAHADPMIAKPSSPCIRRAIGRCYAAVPISFGMPVALPSACR